MRKSLHISSYFLLLTRCLLCKQKFTDFREELYDARFNQEAILVSAREHFERFFSIIVTALLISHVHCVPINRVCHKRGCFRRVIQLIVTCRPVEAHLKEFSQPLPNHARKYSECHSRPYSRPFSRIWGKPVREHIFEASVFGLAGRPVEPNTVTKFRINQHHSHESWEKFRIVSILPAFGENSLVRVFDSSTSTLQAFVKQSIVQSVERSVDSLGRVLYFRIEFNS